MQFSKLEDFGFVKNGQDYFYKENFMEGQFQAQIEISQAGQVSGKVVDLDIKEEYFAFRVQSQTGNFVGQVRAAYIAILEQIAAACFENLPFLKSQTNRLAQRIAKKYGDSYDHPFAKYPAFSAYRHPANHKWYALIMVIARGKLDLGEEEWCQEELEQEIEVINLKVNPADMKDLLAIPGIYPSYHMSKKTWISAVLDEKVSDDFLFSLLANSRALAGGKTLGNLDGPDYWIIPANLKYYDIDAEFADRKIVDWPQKASIKAGDYLFIYITAPTRALRYACKVLEADIKTLHLGQKRMRLELLTKYDDNVFPMKRLKTYGVTNIRGPRRMTKELIDQVRKSL